MVALPNASIEQKSIILKSFATLFSIVSALAFLKEVYFSSLFCHCLHILNARAVSHSLTFIA
jgi:hypothetical protein